MNEKAQALSTLGLSSLQARIYVRLLESGKATTQMLSKSLEIDRSDMYKALIKLRKLGLVEEKIDKPKSFVAIPIRYGISTLLEKKKSDYSKIEQTAKEFLEKFGTFEKRSLTEDDTFLVLTRTDDAPDQIKHQWSSAKESVDGLIQEETFLDYVVTRFQYLHRALQRGVRIRTLIKKNTCRFEKSSRFKKNLNILLANSNYEIRYCNENDLPRFCCFDRIESWIKVSSEPGLQRFPILLSNNEELAKVLSALFERLWNEAVPTTDQERKS